MKKIYGYTRGAHVKARDRSRDVLKQTTAVRQYAWQLMRLYSNLTMGEIYSDVGWKRSGQGMRMLPAARQLLLKIRPGDHLVIGHYSRVFPTTHDFLENMRIWKRQGIVVHLAQKDLKVCMNTPAGALLLRFLQDIDDGRLFAKRQAKIARKWRQHARLRLRVTG